MVRMGCCGLVCGVNLDDHHEARRPVEPALDEPAWGDDRDGFPVFTICFMFSLPQSRSELVEIMSNYCQLVNCLSKLTLWSEKRRAFSTEVMIYVDFSV
jgi:hypothetical protein